MVKLFGDKEKKLLDEFEKLVLEAEEYYKNNNQPEAKSSYLIALRYYIKHTEEIKQYKNEFSRLITLIAKGLYYLDEISRAVESFEKAIALNPQNIDAWLYKGVLHLSQPGTANYAILCFNEVLKLNPEHVVALKNKADALRILNRPDEAMTCYKRIIEIEPDKLENYHPILKLNPDDKDALLKKAALLQKLNRIDEANVIYKHLYEVYPDDADIKEKVVLPGESIEPFKMEMQIATEESSIVNNQSPDTVAPDGIPAKAVSATNTEERTEPLQSTPQKEQIVNYIPVSTETENYIKDERPASIEKIIALITEKNYSTALENVNSLLENDTENLELWILKIKTLFEMGNMNDCAKTINQIIKKNTNISVTWLYKAKIEFAKDAVHKGIIYLKRALSLDSSLREQIENDADIKKIREKTEYSNLFKGL